MTTKGADVTKIVDALRPVIREEIEASEKRLRADMKTEIQESEKRIVKAISDVVGELADNLDDAYAQKEDVDKMREHFHVTP